METTPPHTPRSRNRRLAVTALAASFLAAFAGLAATSRSESCETADARVAFDPVETLTFVPPVGDAPLAFAADKQGEVSVVSGPLPPEVQVPVSENLLARSAVALRFKFAKTTNAKLRFTTATQVMNSLRWVAVEPLDRTCSAITIVNAAPGATTVALTGLSGGPVQVFFDDATSSYDVRLSGRFTANLEYRLVFYASKEKGSPANPSHVYVPLPGQAPPAPDPALKVLPPDFDPETGCLGTDVQHLREAYVAEQRAAAHVQNIDDSFQAATAKKRLRPTKADDEIVRKLTELSLRHLECARKIVAERTDLDETTQGLALSDIDRAISVDEEGLTLLDTVVPGISDPDGQALAQLSQTRLNLLSAMDSKVAAAQRLDPAFVAPALESGFGLGASIDEARGAALDRMDALNRAIDSLAGQLSALNGVAKAEATDGIRRVLASNGNPACRTFLELVLLGEIRAVQVAEEQIRRQAELNQQAGTGDKKAERKVVTVVTQAVKQGTKAASSATKTVKDTTKAVTPRPGATPVPKPKTFTSGVEQAIRDLGKLRGAIARRKALWEKLTR